MNALCLSLWWLWCSRTYTTEHAFPPRVIIHKPSNLFITTAHPFPCSAWGNFVYIFLRKPSMRSNMAKAGFGAGPWLGGRVFSALVKGCQENPPASQSSTVSVKWVAGGQDQPHMPRPLAEGFSDFKIWVQQIFTWNCQQHFPPGTKGRNSQLLQILVCEGEERLKINLWKTETSCSWSIQCVSLPLWTRLVTVSIC